MPVRRYGLARSLRRRGPVWAASLLLLATMTGLAHDWAESQANARLLAAGEHALALHASALGSAISRHDYLPAVLALSPEIIGALKEPGNAPGILAANRFLAEVNRRAQSAAVFVLDLSGTVVASSNWQEPLSFVGSELSYRPYFADALRQGSGRFYGIGTVGGEPGYYFASGIIAGAQAVGVAVVKINLEPLERLWADGAAPFVVTDRHGVVLLASRAEWRFRTLRALAPAVLAGFAATRQYEGASLERLELHDEGAIAARVRAVTLAGRQMLAQEQVLAATGWTLLLLSDRQAAQAFARNTAAAALFATGLLLALALLLQQRRRELRRRLATHDALQRARDELERKVEARTAELVASNHRLAAEIAERSRAEEVLRQAQEQLVQTSKLALLGQLAAGITHELNQPLTAMRTLSDNAIVRLDRGEPDAARRNLTAISGLVDRMGKITGQLKSFARKSPAVLMPVQLAPCIDNALLIVERQLRETGAELELAIPDRELRAIADPYRLEQVLVNLLANALDALAEAPMRRLRIAVETAHDQVSLSVRDSGCGVPAAVLPTIFEPFVTTKDEGKGLGLGLTISASIVESFGGRISAKTLAKGSEFVVELRRQAPVGETGHA